MSVAVELDAQYRALREEAGLFERPQRGLLAVVGGDAAEFLQGQLTNDIEALEPGQGCYAALLDRKGHMQSDMRVLRLGADEILIETEPEPFTAVHRHLDTYRIGRQVELLDQCEERVVLSLIGPRSTELAGGAPLRPEHAHRPARIAEADCLLVATGEGIDLIVPAEAAAKVGEALLDAGAEPVSEAAAEIIRVEAGRPRYGTEMGPATIPQEAGINERAVSFTKGCYIGQETVARLHYKGKPNRHLRRLRSSEPIPAGEAVFSGDREVGTVGTSVISPAAGPLALAILRREATPGSEVLVGEVKATVEEIGP